MITGNGYSLKRFPLLLLLFWIRFLTAFKRENKNYGVSPLWLAGNNPLLLFCASFFSKASKFSFLKIFNSIFEDKQKRAATVILISYQGLCFFFLLPLLINLLFGLLDRVWNARLHAERTWKFRWAQRADKEMWRGKLHSRRKDKSWLSQIAAVRTGASWHTRMMVVSVFGKGVLCIWARRGRDVTVAFWHLWDVWFAGLTLCHPLPRQRWYEG